VNNSLAITSVALLCTALWACGGGGGEQKTPEAPQPPTAPRSLVAAAGNGEVTLGWQIVAQATSYNLYLAAESGVNPVNYTTLNDGAMLPRVPNPTTVINLDNGTLYSFVVTALNAAGESDISNQAQATPLGPPSSNANLSGLSLGAGTLTPMFDPAVTAYSSDVPLATANVTVTPSSEDSAATLTVNGTAVVSGAHGAPLPLGEGANVIDIVVTAQDGITTRTYSVSVTRQSASNFAQQAFVKASNSDAGDGFGYAVALAGDTLVVGAPFEASIDANEDDSSAPDAGAVYVFVRSNDAWTQQAYIKASNAGITDEFGYSVAVSGDTLAVGAHNEASAVSGIDGNQLNNSAAGAGAVYVFTRDGAGNWSQQAYIKASNTGAGDEFGASVALAGDTLAVGAPLEDSATDIINGEQLNESAANAGAVYVFVRNGAGTWQQQAYVKASNTDAGDRFGHRVAMSGDTLAVSARDEDSASVGVGGDQAGDMAVNSGAAYVFVRDGNGQWTQQAYVKASNAGANDIFGASLVLDNDTLAVGSPYEDSAANTINGEQLNEDAFNAGAAYVFVRDGNGLWSQQAYVKSANSETRDLFGWSIALSGDTLLVGATGEASASTGVNSEAGGNDADEAGAAYVFVRNAGLWSQSAYVKPSNTGTEDQFGIGVAVSGETLAIGARAEDSDGTGIDPVPNEDAVDSGAGYVYFRD
jgi:hypothetical protein